MNGGMQEREQREYDVVIPVDIDYVVPVCAMVLRMNAKPACVTAKKVINGPPRLLQKKAAGMEARREAYQR